MFEGKPTLGYPSRCEAAAALYDGGMKQSDIIKAIGAPPTSITHYIQKGRGAAVRRKLQAEAVARGITPTQLRRALIAAVINDDLVAAVLDTGDADGRPE